MRHFFLVFFFVFILSCGAQENLTFGFKSGIIYAKSYTDFSANKVIYGFNFGGIVKKDISNNIGLQAELNYNLKGIESILNNTNPRIEIVNKLGYLDLPVLFNFNFLKGFTLQAGPQLGFLVSKSSKIDGDSIDLDITNPTFGLAGGLEIKIWKGLFTQLRYEHSFSKIIQGDTLKFSVFSVHLGYYF